jgi:tetrahydromethanopterin S-methyltransferase subunit G
MVELKNESSIKETDMVEDKDVETLHKRIDKMTDRFEKCNGAVLDKLNSIQRDVALIKHTCDTRGLTCAIHVEELDKTVRGKGEEGGLITRVTTLEQNSNSKEKFSYLIIGVLGTAAVSVVVALIAHLIGS